MMNMSQISFLAMFTTRTIYLMNGEFTFLRPLWDFGESRCRCFFIGPESDHWLCLSVTHSLTDWLTHCRLVNLIDVTLACEDGNSKLVEVVTVANVDDEDRVGNNLLQIWKLRFGHKAKLLFRLWAQGLVKILKLKFRQDLYGEKIFYVGKKTG